MHTVQIFDVLSLDSIASSLTPVGVVILASSIFAFDFVRRFLYIKFISSLFSRIFISLAALIAVSFVFISLHRCYYFYKIRNSGKENSIIGRVENFRPERYDGEDRLEEHFVIGKYPFEYSKSIFTGGYNGTQNPSFKIGNGKMLKVTFFGSIITRMDSISIASQTKY